MIRFRDSDHNDLFQIPDAGYITITHYDVYPEGEIFIRQCHYIDEYHAKIGNKVYHIDEFADHMKKNEARR
jgi:hypothetical protein